MRQALDFTGKCIGKLTVIEKAESTPDGRSQWLCRCECGNKIVVRTETLKRIKPQNCMCPKCKEKAIDLSGSIIGKLHVISWVPAHSGRKYVCFCTECGATNSVYDFTLRAGIGRCKNCDGTYNKYSSDGNVVTCNIDATRSFKFDLEYADEIAKYHWFASSAHGEHIYTKIEGKLIPLSEVVLRAAGLYKEGMCVLYRDGDKMNYCLSNLEQVSPFKHVHSRKLSKSNTSGYKGINWNKKLGKWIARITVDYKTIHLGTFSKLEDAVRAREDAEAYFGLS